MRGSRLALWPAALALGLTAESVGYGWGSPRDWIPDLATGWVLIACGLVAWSRKPAIRCGALLAATGFAWFVPNFATADVAWVAWLAGQALYLHRGPLVHLLVTYPSGRPRGRVDAAAVAVGWAVAVLPGLWESERAAIVLSAALAALVVVQWTRAAGRERRERGAAARAAGAFSLVVGLTAATRLTEPTLAQGWTLLAYEVVLIGIAFFLVASLLAGRPEAAVIDLVVELAASRSGAHEVALSRALGDPSLELGYWVEAEQAYVDEAGRRLDLPHANPTRAVTRVDRDGEPVAVIVHDPAVLDEPSLVEAVRASAGLASANARLNAEVREQAAAVEASRLRLLRARDEERRRLDSSLREGAERRLQGLRLVLAEARRLSQPETSDRVDRAVDRLDGTLADLRELAAGLHPRELAEHGLGHALGELAERSPTPVRLDVLLEPLPPDVETAVYFVCSEALANVAKYASASSVAVAVAVRDGVVLVDVRDDGVGGADPAEGTGLSGLADRVAALGGTLRVVSPAGGGTRLRAELPLSVLSA